MNSIYCHWLKKTLVCLYLVKEQREQEHERLRQECLHLQSRLSASQAECQKEREVSEDLMLRQKFKVDEVINITGQYIAGEAAAA